MRGFFERLFFFFFFFFFFTHLPRGEARWAASTGRDAGGSRAVGGACLLFWYSVGVGRAERPLGEGGGAGPARRAWRCEAAVADPALHGPLCATRGRPCAGGEPAPLLQGRSRSGEVAGGLAGQNGHLFYSASERGAPALPCFPACPPPPPLPRSHGVFPERFWFRIPKDLPVATAATMVIK